MGTTGVWLTGTRAERSAGTMTVCLAGLQAVRQADVKAARLVDCQTQNPAGTGKVLDVTAMGKPPGRKKKVPSMRAGG